MKSETEEREGGGEKERGGRGREIKSGVVFGEGRGVSVKGRARDRRGGEGTREGRGKDKKVSANFSRTREQTLTNPFLNINALSCSTAPM